MKGHILFLSYDGLTDHLGRSQVIPYLNGFCDSGYSVSVISADKPDKYSNDRELVESELHPSCRWHSLVYHKSPPLLSTWYDLRNMERIADGIIKHEVPTHIHCRSYPAMEVGSSLGKKYDIPVLFDIRGFYPEEKLDGGIWKMNHPLHNYAFHRLKKKEKRFFKQASHVISLTQKGKDLLLTKHPVLQDQDITVIPCCADHDHFKPIGERPSGPIRLLYLGSLGTWYRTDLLLRLYSLLKATHADAELIILSGQDIHMVKDMATRMGIDPDSIQGRQADRNELPELIGQCTLSAFFIKDAYSKAASSPTKLAEILACGLPVICNSEVGDLERISSEMPFVHTMSSDALNEMHIDSVLDKLLSYDRSYISSRSREAFHTQVAIDRYLAVFDVMERDTR
jgi:glycosyltransferase involved in cell wall biosynthesis